MVKIVLDSWKEGFEKITLTKLQINILGKSLKESKSNVDSLLDGRKIIITIDNLDLARKFLIEIEKIGVKGELL